MIGGCSLNNDEAKNLLQPLIQIPQYFFKHTKLVNESNERDKNGSWLFSSCLFNFLQNTNNMAIIDEIYRESIRLNTSIIIVDMMNLLFKQNSMMAVNNLLGKRGQDMGALGYAGKIALISAFVAMKSNFIIVMVGHNDNYVASKYNNNIYFIGMPCFVTNDGIKNKCINTPIGHNESDDYLITFLYGYYKSFGNGSVYLLSSDKYKWYSEYENMNYCKLVVDGRVERVEGVNSVSNDVIEIIEKKNEENVKKNEWTVKKYKLVKGGNA